MFRWPFKKENPAPAPVGDGEQPERDSEHGVALLLTLAALALLMVLAISFSFQSQTNLQGSQVNADTVRARLLAESALERAMAFMTSWYPGQDSGGGPTDMFPATKPSATIRRDRGERFMCGAWPSAWPTASPGTKKPRIAARF